jgi:AsmA protein
LALVQVRTLLTFIEMSKAIRRLLIGAGTVVGLLVILIICVGLYFDVNRYKPQIEAEVAKATGMSLKINGKASLKLIPHVRVTLDEVHLSNAGNELFAAKALDVTPRLFPFLLHRKIVIEKVSLLDPKIDIEKSKSGHLNFETAKRSEGTQGTAGGPGSIHSILIRNGELIYKDHGAGQNIQIIGADVDLSEIAWNPADMMKSLRLNGNVQARSLKFATQKGATTASNLKAKVRDDHGIIRLDPTEVEVFGGVARGNAQIDLRSATPKIEVSQTASHINLAQAVPKLKNKLSGSIDGSVKLTGSGKNVQAMTKSMSGMVSFRSQNIATSVDVDDLAAKLKTAQGMDIVELGASLFSSPLAKAGGQAAGIAGGAPQPKNSIRKLVSVWSINKGVAEAKDVALSTAKTTVAFRGDLNLVDKKYQNFYVATVDQKGCAKNKVEVGGPLNRPRPVAASVGKQFSESYLGSVGKSLSGVFGGKENSQGCDLFYSGSAIHTG